MKKVLVYLFIGLFFSNNVFADTKKTGRCIGYLVSKWEHEGQNSLGIGYNWLMTHADELNITNKINKEQKYCVAPGQDLAPCLKNYSNYEAELYMGMHHGIMLYQEAKFNKAKKAMYDLACSK